MLYNWQGLVQRHFHASVEAQTVMFFLRVASKDEPVDIQTLATDIKITKAAASRTYYRLADGVGGEGGLEYVKAEVDYQDRRRVPLVLTAKGRLVARELTDFIDKMGGRIIREFETMT
jgi:DNA-binding MarR family transcriptional regulator